MNKKIIVIVLFLLVASISALFGQIDPMIQSEWNTISPWNNYCPNIGANTVDAGTGALSVAKIMKYWNYPDAGVGTASYTDDDLGEINQSLAISFNWSRMSNTLYRFQTASLISTVGYGIESDWETDYSTADIEDVMTSMINNFGYSNSMEYHDLATTSFITWRQMINQQLSLGRPVLYQCYATDVDRNYFIIIDGLTADNRYTFLTSLGTYQHYTTNLTDLVVDGHAISVNNQKMLINIIPDNIEEYDESFENGFADNNWYFQGNSGWTLSSNEAYAGTQSARASEIDHNQSSSILIDLSVPAADEISFYIKPSCEYPTEGQYDRAVFYINGVEQDEWYGEGNWTYASYALEPGIYQFKWSYIKDGSVVSGDDTVYLDAIDLPSGVIPLNPPQNLTAVVNDDNAVELNWQAPEGYTRELQGYKIYKNGNELAQSFSPSVTSYTDGNVTNGIHSYAVKAIYNNGLSNPSNTAFVEIQIIYPPTNLQYILTGPGIALISWEASPLVGNYTPDSYRLYLNGAWLTDTTDTEFTLPLEEGAYTFRVTALYDGVESSPTPILNITIGTLPPPSNLTATLYDGNNVHLEWTAPVTPFISGYKIYRNNELLAEITDETTTDYNDEDLPNGSYIYTIKTINNFQSSGPSLAVTVNVMVLLSPINVQSTVVSGVSVQLTWGYPSAANLLDQYKVYRNGNVVASVYNTENPSFFDYNLANGNYNYQVTAIYEGIESDFSETESVEIAYAYPPRNFVATANGSNVQLNWAIPAVQGGASRGLLRYKIYENGEFITNIENTATTTYTINGLMNGTYTFAMAAEYNSGLSVLVEDQVTVEVLYAPQNLAYSIDGQNATISWEAGTLSRELIQYHLYRNDVEYVTTTELFYEDLALSNGYYEYSVVAEYSTGFSEASETISFDLEFPHPVTELEHSIEDNDITFTWERPAFTENERSLVNYELFRNNTSIATTSALTYTDSDLINASYEYYIVVNYTNESSVASNTISIDLINQYPIEDLTASVQTRNNIVLTWDISSYSGQSIENFRLLRNGDILTTTSELTYTDSALEDGEYSYSVIAIYSNGLAEAVNSETIQIEYPYPVSDLTSAVTEDDVLLTWDYQYTGTPIFRIYRDNAYIAETSDLSYNDTNLANGIHSYYIITRNNSDSGNSLASATVNAEVSVTYPVTGLVANVLDDSIQLNWNAPAISSRALSNYKVFVNEELYQDEIENTSYTLTGLANGSYSIFVVATYTNGDSEASNIVNPIIEVKYTPLNFTLNTLGNNVELTWGAPTDATGILNYNVYRNNQVIAQVTSTSYSDNDLVNNNYSYTITSNYESGQSAPTSPEATLIEIYYAVTDLLVQVDNSTFTVTWEDNPLAGSSIVEYQIFMDDEQIAIIEDNSYQSESIANGTYEIAVKAVYASGLSELSEPVTAIINVLYPVNNLAYTLESNNVTLTWQSHPFASDIMGYEISRNDLVLDIVTDLSYTDMNLPNGIHEYQVRAINSFEQASAPAIVNVTIELLYAPNNLTYDVVDDSVILNWEEPNSMYRGFIGYKLFKGEELLTSLTELTYTDNNLMNGDYSYSVKAQYSSGDSEATNSVTANVEVLYPAINLALDIMEDDASLTWESNPMSGNSIIDYTIYRNEENIGNITELSYLDQALANGDYQYNVAVNYLTGTSELSEAVSALVEVLYAPEDLNCLVDGNSVLISWEAAATSSRGFLGYNLYRDNELIFSDASATSYNDLNLINNNYEYKVEASYSTGISEALTASVTIEVLYPVINFTGSLTETEISLAWENDPLAGNTVLSYSLYRNNELYASQTELSFLDSALANGNYEYSVVANYNNGSAIASEILDFFVEITYPANNLTAQVTADIVNLTWDLPANSPRALLSYNIYRDGEIVGNSEELTYSDTFLANGTYSYFVTAIYTSGESDPSNSVEAFVEVPYPIQNLVSSVEENDVTLTWDIPATSARNLLSYTILRDNEEIASVTETSYTDSNLYNNTYNYAVKAVYTSGESIEVSTSILVEVLYPAMNLALEIFEDDATLTWETNVMSGASIIDYTIYRDGQNIGNVAELSYFDQALANASYEYSLAVNYLTGSSELAEAVSGLVEVLYAPQDLNCLVENNNVLVSWNAAPTSSRGFLGYNLYRDNELIFSDASATSYNDLDLINNSYEYKVEASYSTGISEALTASVIIEVLYPVINFTGSLTETEVNLAWENNSFAGNSVLSYSLYRNSELYDTVTELSYLDSALANGSYEYSVVANYNNGYSIASDILDFFVEITYPANNLSAQVTADVVNLTWDLPANSPRALLSYNIYRDGEIIANSEDLNYSDQALANATYSYFVTAVYTSGESAPSNSVEAIVEVLYVPNNLTYSVMGNSVTLNWDQPNASYRGFIGYKLFKDQELLTSLTELSYTDSDLANGDYTYSVKAEYTSGDSEASNEVNVNIEVLYPASNLTGSLLNDEVTLSWDTPSELYRNFLGYNIYRNNELIDSTTETSFVDSNLANGNHSYYITANYTSGESNPTNSVDFFVEITYPVTSLSASVDENNVTLTWDIPAISAQTRAFRGYFIYRNNAIEAVIDNPATTTWTDNSLANGDYDYYLKAVYDAGISVESNHVSVNIEILPDLFAPTNLQLFVEDASDVHLTWDIPADEVINYLIFKDNMEIASTTDNSYWDLDLANGSYQYFVKAVYPEGTSSPSNSVIANIASTDTPTNLTATITNGNDVVLTWEAPNNGETAFIINRNGQELSYISNVAQVEYTDQALTNALYTYTIRAVYNNLVSELSNPAYADIMKSYIPQISESSVVNNSISLTWEDLSPWGRLVDYTVYKNGQEIANTSNTSYSETGLTNEVYEYTVKANFDFASSEESTPVSLVVLVAQMVSNVSSTMIGNDLVLSWDYPLDTGLITSYNVYRNNVLIATTQENSYSDVDLMNGDYSYQVMTYYNDTINNPISPAITVSYIQAQAVTNLTATIDGESIVVAWDSPLDMYGFQHYKVFRNEQFIMTLYAGATGFVNNIPENGLYQYTIKSVYLNGATVSVLSEAINFLIPVSPTNLTISANETVNLSWDFTGTEYAFIGFDIFNNTEFLASTTDTSYELDLANGNYDFLIRTSYSEITSEFSETLSYELVRTYPVINASAEVTENDISLNWDTPSDTYGLENITIIRTQSAEASRLEIVLDANTTSYFDEDLLAGIYNYDIIANYDSSIQEDKIISINDLALIIQMPVTDLAVTADNDDLTLTWTEPLNTLGFVNYQVYQNDTMIATTENTEYIFTDQANGDYSFYVKSIYENELVAFSVTLDYSLVIAYPALNPSLNVTDNNIVLSWDAPSDNFGLVGYKLYAMNADDVNQPQLWVTIDTLITETSLTDDISELASGDYRWAVVSVYRNLQSNTTLYSEATISDIVTDNSTEDTFALTTINGNYPNPFNPETRLSFQIAKDGFVSMNVYNMKGQLVKSLVNGTMKSGSHTIIWNGEDESGRLVSSGVYFFRLSSNGVNKIHKCSLMK